MKYFITALFICSSLLVKAQRITAADAANYIGKTVTVCDTVTSVFTSNKSEKAPTLLDIGGKYPNNVFTAVVFKDKVANFSYDLATLKGKAICITGEVKDYKGKPEIIIDNEKQITIKAGERE